jgi:hypothetical protein
LTGSVLFITVPYSSIIDEKVLQNKTAVNILIDIIDIDLSKLRQYLGFNCQHIFSLQARVLNNTDISGLLPDLYTLFVLSGCYVKNKKAIPVFIDDASDDISNLHLIENYFKLQGEENVEFVLFDRTDNQTKNNILLISPEQLEKFDQAYLDEFYCQNIEQVILLNSKTPEMNKEIIDDKSLTEQNKCIKIFLEMIALQQQANKFTYQSSLWQKRSSLYFSFISLSKKVGENQYYDILKWYENEYEILPLWYKRFGHIIKVITGKRTFRSLFNDNIKKHKD